MKLQKSIQVTLLSSILLMLFGNAVFGQDNSDEKRTAFKFCQNKIEQEPRKALAPCRDYLNKYANPNPLYDGYVINFVNTFSKTEDKFSRYLNSVSEKLFTEQSDSWAIYKPDLQRNIPLVNRTNDNHQIEITRTYASPEEQRLLSKAEAVYLPYSKTREDLEKNWIYWTQEITPPLGEPQWWDSFTDTILDTRIVTTAAALYYINLTQTLIENNNRVKENNFRYLKTNFKYWSSIQKLSEYQRNGKNFRNVYVADMNLRWSGICGGRCGHGFTRNKVVVLDEEGNIMEMFLDAKVNFGSWIS